MRRDGFLKTVDGTRKPITTNLCSSLKFAAGDFACFFRANPFGPVDPSKGKRANQTISPGNQRTAHIVPFFLNRVKINFR